MSRKIKCCDTGLFASSDEAYKAPNNKYYSSEEAYLKLSNNENYRRLCYNKMYQLLGYSGKMVIPGIFVKKLSEYADMGYECVYNTFVTQEDRITWVLNHKEFKNESQKIAYIMAIISNCAMDEYKKLNIQMAQKERIKAEEPLEEVIINKDLRKQETKNISKFLKED